MWVCIYVLILNDRILGLGNVTCNNDREAIYFSRTVLRIS